MAEQTKKEKDALEKQRLQLVADKEKQDDVLKERMTEALTAEREKINKEVLEGYDEKIKSLEAENERRRNENKVFMQKEVELMRREGDMKDKLQSMNLEVEKKMLERQAEIEDRAKKSERESFELEKMKLLKQIDDNKKLAEEMKRKAEQGSMQMQGEVQELALEHLLAQAYPFDKIQEVAKGVRGADCIQVVINGMQQTCGSIVYESKRTKAFAGDWIDKLKQDQISCKADIAVLVTETMPSDMDMFGVRDGVWVCRFKEVKSVSMVLRVLLITTQSVKIAQENKGDKMELMYAYLTSTEFVQNIRRIVENYNTMVEQLNTEKRSFHKIWAAREKQMWVVQENISALFGSISGIAGKELDTDGVLQLADVRGGEVEVAEGEAGVQIGSSRGQTTQGATALKYRGDMEG